MLCAVADKAIDERYWGAHLSIVRQGAAMLVSRDPSGALPCYYATAGGRTVLASSAQLLVDSGLVADRALVRSAFRSSLPKIVLDRRTKGGPDGFAIGLLRSNLPAVRERLLDGRLATSGLLDRPALEAALAPDRLGFDTAYVRLLGLLDCEAWTNIWHERLQCARNPASNSGA